jgi:uncharacterized protein (DUF427 family)
MNSIKKTGGARIGRANATWPFATLTVTKHYIRLNASILGNYIFKSSDIVSIEAFRGSGIKINHTVSDYKEKIIFWTMGNPKEMIRKIEESGFLSNTDPIPEEVQKEIDGFQSKGGFPLKRNSTIAIVVLWNVFIVYDIINFTSESEESPMGIGTKLALGFLLLISILLLSSGHARKLILKEGRRLDDIKIFLYFIIFICTFMALMISFVG